MIRFVLDSNVFISALLFGGNPRRVIGLGELGLLEFYFSKPIRIEVERVLSDKFRWSDERVAVVTHYLWRLGRNVEPQLVIDDCIDRDDNRVLECALAAKAGWIVTGDQHLLLLHPYRQIAIVTPRDFLDSKAWQTDL